VGLLQGLDGFLPSVLELLALYAVVLCQLAALRFILLDDLLDTLLLAAFEP